MSFYSRMKQRLKNEASESTYANFLLNSLCNMFKWKNLPFEQRYIEEYLHIDSYFGIKKDESLPEGFAISPAPAINGILDQFGFGDHVDGVTISGNAQVRGKIGEDVLLCFNNTMRCGDFDVMQYASYLSTVDISIIANTKLSGLAPILGADDSKSASAIESYMSELLSGNVRVIASNNVIRQLQEAAGNGIFSVDITNPERVRYTEYLSSLWGDLFKRFFCKYGLNIQNVNKLAQTSEDEVHGMDCVSWVLPLDMLRCRKNFCQQANLLFGTDWDVEFEEPWKQEYEAFVKRKKIEDVKTEIESLKEGEENEEKSEISTE